MTSIRHNDDPDDSLLDAARECILAVGWRRTTLTDVARRAGVSRMTIYRRWPDTHTLLSDLMVREWSAVIEDAAVSKGAAGRSTGPAALASGVASTVRGLRENALFTKIVEVDPELLLPYLLDRRGRTQDSMLGLLEQAISEGHSAGTVRAGDPALMARSILLTAHGFAVSAQTMTAVADSGSRGSPIADLDTELRTLLQRYLTP